MGCVETLMSLKASLCHQDVLCKNGGRRIGSGGMQYVAKGIRRLTSYSQFLESLSNLLSAAELSLPMHN